MKLTRTIIFLFSILFFLATSCRKEPQRVLTSIRILQFTLQTQTPNLQFPPVAGNIDVSTLLRDIDDAERYYAQLAQLYEFKSFRFLASQQIDTLLPLRDKTKQSLFRIQKDDKRTEIDLIGVDSNRLRFCFQQLFQQKMLRNFDFSVDFGKSLSLATMIDTSGREGILYVISVEGIPLASQTTFESVERFLEQKNRNTLSNKTGSTPEFRKHDQELVDAIFGVGKHTLPIVSHRIDTANSEDAAQSFRSMKIDREPQPVGGMQAVVQKIKYPPSAIRDTLQGRVFISLLVDVDGTIKQKKIVRSVRSDLDSAALSALDGIRFEPAQSEGKPVKIWVTLPIDFRLK